MASIPRPRTGVRPVGGSVGRQRISAPVEAFGGGQGLQDIGRGVAAVGGELVDRAKEQQREAERQKREAEALDRERQRLVKQEDNADFALMVAKATTRFSEAKMSSRLNSKELHEIDSNYDGALADIDQSMQKAFRNESGKQRFVQWFENEATKRRQEQFELKHNLYTRINKSRTESAINELKSNVIDFKTAEEAKDGIARTIDGSDLREEDKDIETRAQFRDVERTLYKSEINRLQALPDAELDFEATVLSNFISNSEVLNNQDKEELLAITKSAPSKIRKARKQQIKLAEREKRDEYSTALQEANSDEERAIEADRLIMQNPQDRNVIRKLQSDWNNPSDPNALYEISRMDADGSISSGDIDDKIDKFMRQGRLSSADVIRLREDNKKRLEGAQSKTYKGFVDGIEQQLNLGETIIDLDDQDIAELPTRAKPAKRAQLKRDLELLNGWAKEYIRLNPYATKSQVMDVFQKDIVRIATDKSREDLVESIKSSISKERTEFEEERIEREANQRQEDRFKSSRTGRDLKKTSTDNLKKILESLK